MSKPARDESGNDNEQITDNSQISNDLKWYVERAQKYS